MYLTVDCAKLNGETIILYEFYDITVDNEIIDYYKEKIKALRNLVEIVYVIYYKSTDTLDYTNISIMKFSEGDSEEILTNVDFETFKNWYADQNASTQIGDSKKFGDISNDGDKYVEAILSELVGYNLMNDNNGRNLIIPALKGLNTHFFDFDLLHSENKFNIEFLKNETHIKKRNKEQKWELDNIATHPNRYWSKNKKKFLTLWEASKIFNSDLYLVSYSEDTNKALHLMKIYGVNDEGITFDIGFKLSYANFIEWLEQMNRSRIHGFEYLINNNFLYMIRDKTFWNQDKTTWKKELKNFKREYKNENTTI